MRFQSPSLYSSRSHFPPAPNPVIIHRANCTPLGFPAVRRTYSNLRPPPARPDRSLVDHIKHIISFAYAQTLIPVADAYGIRGTYVRIKRKYLFRCVRTLQCPFIVSETTSWLRTHVKQIVWRTVGGVGGGEVRVQHYRSRINSPFDGPLITIKQQRRQLTTGPRD